MRSISLLSSALLFGVAIVGCKPNHKNADASGLEMQNPMSAQTTLPEGLSNFGVALATGGNLNFYLYDFDEGAFKTDPKYPNKDSNGSITHSFPMRQVNKGVEITIGAKTLLVPKNAMTSYGFETTDKKDEWTCDDAMALLRNSQQKFPGTCFVALNTEDRSWFTVTVINRGASGNARLQYDYKQNPAAVAARAYLAKMPLKNHPMSAASPSLNPGEVNMDINAKDGKAILDVMKNWQRKYIAGASNEEERGACLKNGRAAGWLDIQAHFYCNLPYSPHRSCYSSSLITLTKVMPADNAGKVKTLITAFNTSFNSCFASGANAMSPEEAAAFKYVMFTRNGVFDFNIEAQNNLIDQFYQRDVNYRRVADPFPYEADQPRYDKIRFVQAKALGMP